MYWEWFTFEDLEASVRKTICIIFTHSKEKFYYRTKINLLEFYKSTKNRDFSELCIFKISDEKV